MKMAILDINRPKTMLTSNFRSILIISSQRDNQIPTELDNDLNN